MIKKITTSILLMFVLSFGVVSAQTDRKGPNFPAVPTFRANVATATREKISERIENRIDQRRETLIQIARNRFEKMIKRFEATIQREESIMAKIMSRVEKVKSNGGNTAEAEKNLGEAKMHFDEAKVSLNLLKNATSSAETLVDSSIATSTSAKNTLKKIKDLAKNIEKHIREGHSSLTKAVKALRGMSGANASTTPKATTTSSSN